MHVSAPRVWLRLPFVHRAIFRAAHHFRRGGSWWHEYYSTSIISASLAATSPKSEVTKTVLILTDVTDLGEAGGGSVAWTVERFVRLVKEEEERKQKAAAKTKAVAKPAKKKKK